jgi:hypothetical protein
LTDSSGRIIGCGKIVVEAASEPDRELGFRSGLSAPADRRIRAVSGRVVVGFRDVVVVNVIVVVVVAPSVVGVVAVVVLFVGERLDQGCQICIGTTNQNGGKFTKRHPKIPNDHIHM